MAIGKAAVAGPIGNGTSFALKIDAWQVCVFVVNECGDMCG